MIEDRSDIEIGIEYGPGSAEKIIQKSREGDRFILDRLGERYPQIEVVVKEYTRGEAMVVDDNENEYRLLPYHWVNLRSGPWLKEGSESKGQIEGLTVLELGEEEKS